MSKDEQGKLESGAVYWRGGSERRSSLQAKMVVSSDGFSNCGAANVLGLASDGWIGGAAYELPEDGWTCKDGEFSAHIVRAAKSQGGR